VIAEVPGHGQVAGGERSRVAARRAGVREALGAELADGVKHQVLGGLAARVRRRVDPGQHRLVHQPDDRRMTWSSSRPSAHTSSAALKVNGPAKTERRAHIACSAGVQRS